MHHNIWIFWEMYELYLIIKIFKLTLYKLGLIPSWVGSFFLIKKSNKNPWLEPSCKRQKGRQKKGQKMCNSQDQKKKKERALVLVVVGSYVTHIPFHVTYMQIVTSNSNRRPKTSISFQPIFFYVTKAKHVEKQY